jgi:ketosteroid isomerase-like protein
MIRGFAVLILAPIMLFASGWAAQSKGDAELLKTREAVWRAWFANDTKTLQELVPLDTIVISAGEEKWKGQPEVFQGAAQFQSSGGKLVRLEFPRTQIQHLGNVAIIWSKYLVETEEAGKRTVTSGRVSEIFVWRQGRWMNSGWHTDAEK